MMNHSGMSHPHHAMGGMDTTMPTTMDPHPHHNHNHAMMGNNSSGGVMSGGSHTHDMHMGAGDNSMHDMHMMDMMKMYFHTGVKEYVLFESCHTNSDKEMIIACVVIFLVAIFYEGLKFLREMMLQRSLQHRSPGYYPDSKMPPGSSQEQMVIRGASSSVTSQMLNSSHALQTFLHVVQIFVSYCLMLVFMTYNVWLCVAVVLGAGVGYFCFGWKRAVVVDANEHCH